MLSTSAQAQVTDLEGRSLPLLNDQLREIDTRIRALEGVTTSDGSLDLADVSGVLATANGGTGEALSLPATSDVLIFGDNGAMGLLALGTNLSITGQTISASDDSASNVVFCYVGQTNASSALYVGTDVAPGTGFTKNLAFWATEGHSNGGAEAVTQEVIDGKWKKIVGVNTITVYALIWQDGANGSAICRLTIGSATNSVTGTANQETPEWKTFNVDVSGLVDGTVYDLSVKLSHTYSANPTTQPVFLGSIIGFGS